MLASAPSRNALDDEEALTGLHEAEPARLTDELLPRAHGGNPQLELLFLPLQSRHVGLVGAQQPLSVQIGVKRLPVEKGDEHEPAEGKQPRWPEHAPLFALADVAPTGCPALGTTPEEDTVPVESDHAVACEPLRVDVGIVGRALEEFPARGSTAELALPASACPDRQTISALSRDATAWRGIVHRGGIPHLVAGDRLT